MRFVMLIGLGVILTIIGQSSTGITKRPSAVVPPKPRTITLSWTGTDQLLTTTNLAVPVSEWSVIDVQTKTTVVLPVAAESQFFMRMQQGWLDYDTISEYGLVDQVTWETNGVLNIN